MKNFINLFTKKIFIKNGFSITEICIAIAILALSFGSIVVFFRSASLESTYTAEHFTAMFLAQKIIEDINSRVKVDPYFFTELIQNAIGKEEPVVGINCSKYFRLIENTKNFAYLSVDDDEPITSGDLYEQLKNFTVQVSTYFVENPITKQPYENLIKLDVILRWPTIGSNIKREYKLSQYLYGFSDNIYKNFPNIKLSNEERHRLELGSLEYLANIFGTPKENFNLSSLQARFRDSLIEDLLNLGLIGYVLKLGIEVEEQYKTKIERLENIRNEYVGKHEIRDRLNYLDLQVKIASLYEEKAFQMIYLLLIIKEPLNDLINSLTSKSSQIVRVSRYFNRYSRNVSRPSTHTINQQTNSSNSNPINNSKFINNNIDNASNTIFDDLSDIFTSKEYYEKYSNTLNSIFNIVRFIPTSLSTVEDIYLKLMQPPFIDLLSGGREIDFIKKFVDIQKLAVLRTMNFLEANKQLLFYRNTLNTIYKRFLGKFPVMVEYIEKELKIAQDLHTFRNKFSGIFDLFQYLDLIDEKIVNLKNILPQPN